MTFIILRRTKRVLTMKRTRATKNQLAKMLRQLKPLVTGRGPRTITTISLSASERALLDEAARVHQISRAAVLRTGLPLAVAQLLTATTTLGAKEDRDGGTANML